MERETDMTLRFRPLTLFVLEYACAVLEIDMNHVLQGDLEEGMKKVTREQARRFCGVVLVEPIAAWDAMPPNEAEALTVLVINSFFGTYYGQQMAIVSTVMRALYERTGVPDGGRYGSVAIQRVLAEYPPDDYHTLVHQMPISEALIYLSTCTVNAIYRKSKR